MWCELFNENEHFSDITHHTPPQKKMLMVITMMLVRQLGSGLDDVHDGVGDDDGNEGEDVDNGDDEGAYNGDDGAVKATGISPPRFAKKLRLDQASLPPTQLPQEIQVLIQ